MRSTVLLGLIVCLTGVAVGGQAPAAAQTRVGLALVIGNSKYAQAELPSVDLDRKYTADALRSLGFQVTEVENLARPRDFEEELHAFLEREHAAPEDTLVVYYSGHGLQLDGRAYLLGTGLPGSGDVSGALRDYSENVDNIIRIMEQAAPAARVLIVDACRNNAFNVAPKKAGAAFQRDIEDTYILFADEPGKSVPARSDATVQSPFTAGLLYALENSTGSLEERFDIAREKTRDLNPGQNPQMLKSDPSPNRNRAFLDHAGRSAPSGSATRMLREAGALYQARSWNAFQDKISGARILSSDPELVARLDKEMAFSTAVVDAETSESELGGRRWADAAAAWSKAGTIFSARTWVFERAAIDWLLADRVPEAVNVLGRLQGYGGAAGDRAHAILAGLANADPSVVPAPNVSGGTPPPGPEFEPYEVAR